MADSKISALAADTSPTADDLVVLVNDPGGTPANKKATIANLLKLVAVQQVVEAHTTAVASGTTTIPLDDTIPQNTEGDEYLTVSITPKSATNKLDIEFVGFGGTVGGSWIVYALFQDTTAGALAAAAVYNNFSTAVMCLPLNYTMTSGTTSATTFKIRIGWAVNSATFTLNGTNGGRLLGGVFNTSIKVTERLP